MIPTAETSASQIINPLILNLVRFKFISDGLNVQTELTRGFGLVVTRLLERLENQLAFSLCRGYSERQHDFAGRFRSRILKVRRKMEGLNPLTPRKDQCAFHDITEFPNVAWPRVGH